MNAVILVFITIDGIIVNRVLLLIEKCTKILFYSFIQTYEMINKSVVWFYKRK